MSQFLKDSFTGTAGTQLSAHTGEIGATWTPAGWATGSTMTLDGSGRALIGNITNYECTMFASGTPANGNCTITIPLIISGTNNGQFLLASLWARAVSGSSSLNGYYLSYNLSNAIISITRYVNGTGTSLVQNPCPFPLAAGTYSITWSMNGANQSVSIQRASDQNYLTAGGTWQVSSVSCLTASDGTFTTGKIGLDYFAQSNGATGATTFAEWGAISATDILAALAIPPNDVNLIYSSFNWLKNGSTYAQTNYRGASLKTAFTGTSLSMTVDVSPLVAAGATSAQYPWIRWSIDGNAKTDLQLTSASSTIALANSLASGTHAVDLFVFSTDSFLDRWATPANVLRITGFAVDNRSTTATRTDLQPKTALFFGDSITECDGVWGLGTGNTGSPPNNDATAGWGNGVALALDAEPSIVGIGGQGWQVAGAGGPPKFPLTWNMIDANHARDFSTPPNYVFINQGTNGGTSSVGYPPGTLGPVLASMRTAFGTATWIFLMIPFGGYNRAAMTADYASYQAATPDANLALLDLGTNAQTGLDRLPPYPQTFVADPSYQSFGGIHPKAFTHGRLAALTSTDVNAALKGLTGTYNSTPDDRAATVAAIAIRFGLTPTTSLYTGPPLPSNGQSYPVDGNGHPIVSPDGLAIIYEVTSPPEYPVESGS